MAEVAPLTLAQAHARKAAEETQQVHWNTAADEHQGAATDFARAARSTSDVEALRVLKLLEDQHHRLARIIRTQSTVDAPETVVEESPAVESLRSKTESPTLSPPEKAAFTKTKPTTSALAAARIGSHARDASPSITRELASRRGIPQTGRTQPSPAAQARARQLSPESRRSVRSSQRLAVPPSVVDSQASLAQARIAKKAEDDEGFAKFYSNLTSGTMSKLSSVLAYAGLPLTSDDIKSEPMTRSSKQTVSASHEPDVKKYFSKAALDAIEEEHRQRGTLGRGFNPAESFYVVPPTGMTTSFAEMARKRGDRFGEDDDDAFVDAREVPGPPSPRHSRSAQASRGSFGKARTEEELELENTTLKLTLEQLAGRLANFEAHAQDASMAALTQSMVALRPPTAAPDSATLERLRQLEQQVEKGAEERQKLQDLARKQEKELKRWDARYDKLKAGAREKQKAKVTAGKGGEEAAGEPS